MSKPEHDELRRQITDLLAKGLIEPSSSPFAAPVLFVQKKSGELRMCIDYRQLNKITIRDQYPLPRIDDLFDQLAGKTVFSSLDLQAGYHQIRIPAEDVPKTAFRTPEGHYQFKVLCFGLTNAPATFQRVMNEAFAEVINDCALVYLDDILVMSENTEQHLVHLRRVFDLLRKNKFYAKLSKCEFMKRTLMFLGHIISAQGISVDPCKVTAISNWPVPTSLKTLQSFLGAANYVRKFVHNFSTIAAPLTNLTGPKKDSFPWKAWPQAELDAFNALKQAISNVPMLKLPDHSKPFQVHCDASLEGIGAVLMQDGYPLAYYSRKLIPAEVNYTTGEQELLALWLVRAYAADSNFTKRRKTKNYYLDDNGLWRHNKRRTVIVPRDKQLREHILHEMHDAKKSSDSVFQVGDRVLLSTMNLRNMVGKARKLLPRYVGPFRIEAHVEEGYTPTHIETISREEAKDVCTCELCWLPRGDSPTCHNCKRAYHPACLEEAHLSGHKEPGYWLCPICKFGSNDFKTTMRQSAHSDVIRVHWHPTLEPAPLITAHLDYIAKRNDYDDVTAQPLPLILQCERHVHLEMSNAVSTIHTLAQQLSPGLERDPRESNPNGVDLLAAVFAAEAVLLAEQQEHMA
ncbi:hypothetical protein QJQ45_005826 [Haematococcus lacustris]|nr:hypothetical protein QJQ45_005826 [Haematococcus lacustris]